MNKIVVNIVTVLIAVSILAACGPATGGLPAAATVTLTPSPSATPLPTSTPVPTATPIPTATPVSFSAGAEMGLIEQLRSYGTGRLQDVEYATAGGQVAFATIAGVYLLEAENLDVQLFVPVDEVAYRIAYSVDGALLAVSTYAGSILVLDTGTGAEVARIEGGDGFTALAFSPDGRYLAAAGGKDYVIVWETADWSTNRSLYARSVVDMAFTLDSEFLVVATADRLQIHTCCTWSMSSTINQVRYDDRTYLLGSITDIDLSPDGSLLAVGADDEQTIAVLEVPSWKGYFAAVMDPRPGEMRYPWVNGVSFSDNGKRLAYVGRPRSGWINMVTRELSFQHSTSGGSLVAIDPSAEQVVIGSDLYNLVNWTVQRTFDPNPVGGAESYFPSPQRSPGGKWEVRTDDRAGTLTLWDLGADAALFSVRGHFPTVVAVVPQLVGDIAWARDESFFVTGGYDRQVKLWHVAADPQPVAIGSMPDMVLAVAVSSDGSMIAAGDGQGNFAIWSYVEDKVSLLLRGVHPATNMLDRQDRYILSLEFSPDGEVLATGGSPTIALWRVGDGSLLGTIAHGVRVEALHFSDDGLVLFSKFGRTDQGGVLIRSWGVRPGGN